ncbi:AI-2E family transporter [Haloparvum sp. AD34]
MVERQRVLSALLVLLVLLALALLWEVAATVFFALTVAYVLAPVRRQLRRRGASQRVASLTATFAGFVGTLAVFSPVGALLFLRLDDFVAFLRGMPDEVTITVREFSTTVVTADLIGRGVDLLAATARAVGGAMPVLLIKLGLFVFVVYGLLYYESRTRQATMGLVPPAYRDVADSLHVRARQTLYGIYVVQAATAIATVVIAIPVFVAFGYPSPFSLAAVAGVLQFIPVLGPIVLILGLVAYHLLLGEVALAVALFFVGGFLIAWAPDLFIRPRLAAETAQIPATLYFIGFVGGVLTVGTIGVIVGPLVIAVTAEVADQLAEEFNAVPVREE